MYFWSKWIYCLYPPGWNTRTIWNHSALSCHVGMDWMTEEQHPLKQQGFVGTSLYVCGGFVYRGLLQVLCSGFSLSGLTVYRNVILSWKVCERKKEKTLGDLMTLAGSDLRHSSSRVGAQRQRKQNWGSLVLNNVSLWWSHSCPEQVKSWRAIAKWLLYITLKQHK